MKRAIELAILIVSIIAMIGLVVFCVQKATKQFTKVAVALAQCP